MAKKLSQKTLDKMFKAYCERQSVHYVSKKYTVSRNTVDKYKRLQNWDGRLAKIQQKAQEKQDDNLAKVLADNLRFVKYAKGKVIELMQAGGQVSRTPVSDLDKMIRLELSLMGQVDSRAETVRNNELKDVPTEELIRMQKALKEINDNEKRSINRRTCI